MLAPLLYIVRKVTEPVAQLIDLDIMPTDHNGAANLLRKGLGIVAFNILEDFIKNKALETLDHISNSEVPFSYLSDKLQEAATLGALNALSFRAKIAKKDNAPWKLLIQDEAIKIHSTKNDIFELSAFSLASSGSNVSAVEVTELMQAFDIKGGWGKLKEVSDSISGGITDLCQSYKNAADRRNSSAHTADFRYEYSWLREIKSEIIAIAASLDILLTARCRQVDRNHGCPLSDHDINSDLNYRYLKEDGPHPIHKEVTVIGGRSRKNWNSVDEALIILKPKLVPRKEFLIILDKSSRIIDWAV